MSAIVSPHSEGPRMRLFCPDASDELPGLSRRPIDRCTPQMRLRDFVKSYVIPVPCKAKRLSKVTADMYLVVADYWSELTNDRGLEDIGQDDGADFLDGLSRQPGRGEEECMAAATVARHAKNLQRILDCAGPKTRHGKWGPYGTGLIDNVPYIEPPEVISDLPNGDFTLEEVTAILAACKKGKCPEDYRGSAEEFWRALVIFLCFTGLRIRETMSLEWSMIDRQLLLIPKAITKTKRGRLKYLPQAALAAIEPLKGISKRIFAWPGWPNAGAVRWLQRRREQLVIDAGLAEHRRFGFHGFRKYHATYVDELDEDSPGPSAAQLSLGHTSEEVTLGAYINGSAQQRKEIKRQKAAIDRMPSLG